MNVFETFINNTCLQNQNKKWLDLNLFKSNGLIGVSCVPSMLWVDWHARDPRFFFSRELQLHVGGCIVGTKMLLKIQRDRHEPALEYTFLTSHP